MTPQSSNMCRSEDNPTYPLETKDTTPAGVKEIWNEAKKNLQLHHYPISALKKKKLERIQLEFCTVLLTKRLLYWVGKTFFACQIYVKTNEAKAMLTIINLLINWLTKVWKEKNFPHVLWCYNTWLWPLSFMAIISHFDLTITRRVNIMLCCLYLWLLVHYHKQTYHWHTHKWLALL